MDRPRARLKIRVNPIPTKNFAKMELLDVKTGVS